MDVYAVGSSFHQINPALCVAVNKSKQCFGAALCLACVQEKASGDVVGAVVIAVIGLSLWDSPGMLIYGHGLFSVVS